MFRYAVGAAALAAVGLSGLPASAPAATAPPALTGEQLSTSEYVYSGNGAFPFTLPCDGSSGEVQANRFNVSGTAAGPYVGSFVERGTATYDTAVEPDPRATTNLLRYRARFTIDAADGTVVTGTETMTGDAAVTCQTSAGGTDATVGPVSTTYSATIKTGRRRYTDSGTDDGVMLGQSLVEGLNWYATLNDDGFASDGLLRQRRHHPLF